MKRIRSFDTLEECTAKRVRLLAELEMVDARINELKKPVVASSPPDAAATARVCPKCGNAAVQKKSTTEKNPGRLFWACLNRCEGWIGWVDSVPVVVVVVPATTKPPAPVNVYKCERCAKVLDLDYETNVYIKSVTATVPYAQHLRSQVMGEFKSAMEDDEFVCAACVNKPLR